MIRPYFPSPTVRSTSLSSTMAWNASREICPPLLLPASSTRRRKEAIPCRPWERMCDRSFATRPPRPPRIFSAYSRPSSPRGGGAHTATMVSLTRLFTITDGRRGIGYSRARSSLNQYDGGVSYPELRIIICEVESFLSTRHERPFSVEKWRRSSCPCASL